MPTVPAPAPTSGPAIIALTLALTLAMTLALAGGACDRDAIDVGRGDASLDAETLDGGILRGDDKVPPPDDRLAADLPRDLAGEGTRDTATDAARDMTADMRPGPIDGPARSGLDPGRRVASLGDPELGRLCDWGVGILGGYGAVTRCPGGGGRTNSPSQQACIAGHDRSARCYSTVGQSENCLVALSQDPCSPTVLFTPDCQAMASCQRP